MTMTLAPKVGIVIFFIMIKKQITKGEIWIGLDLHLP
jgi:hypothetical protein